MATNVIKVRLKDASQNVLHPETEWSLVQGKPSFETIEDSHGNVSQKWNANAKGENIEIDGGNVSIYSRDTGISLESSDDIYLSGGNVYINEIPLADYPIKPKGVLKSKNMKVQELVNDKNLIDKIVKIEKLEFGVGGYVKDRFACNWLWSSGNYGTANDYILYYPDVVNGTNKRLNATDDILVTYLDLPITWENMPA